MPQYRVQVEYDTEADNAEAAAREVWSWMQDPETIPPVCDVMVLDDDKPDDWGNAFEVDLNEGESDA